MEAIRGHQLDVGVLARGDHLLALAIGDGERLLAENMDARVGRANRERRVLRVGQRDVDGIDLAQAVLELVVGAACRRLVAIAQLSELLGVMADSACRTEFRLA